MWCSNRMFATIWPVLRCVVRHYWLPVVTALVLLHVSTIAHAQTGTNTELTVVARHSLLAGQSENALVAMLTLPLGTTRLPNGSARPVLAKRQDPGAEPMPDPAPAVPAVSAHPPSPPRPNPQNSALIQRLLDGALRTSGLAQAAERLSNLATRQRSAALLPTVMLRAGRHADLRATSTTDDLGTTNEDATSAARTYYEARLTFRLDRLASGDDEATLERLREDLISQRTKLFREVIAEYNRHIHAARIFETSEDAALRQEAAEEAAAADATLFALTGIALAPPGER